MPSTGTPSLKTMSGARGAFALGDRGRPARQDDRARREIADLSLVDREGVDLAVDAAFAHAARDQLGYLAAEIEDQNAVRHVFQYSSIGPVGPGRFATCSQQ